LDLGMVNEAIHELEESLPSAIRAHEYQTTVPHWGQLARAYAALGQVDKMMDAINWILQFITSTGYQSIESIMPLLIACQLAAVGTSSKVFATAHACLAQLEQHAQQFHTEEADAALAEAQGVLRLREGHPLEAAENFRQAALSWEIIERRYDQARSLGHYGHALAAQGDRSGAKSAYHQALGIIYSLANQLNSDHRTVFLDSPMVVDFRQAEEALSPISLPKPSESDASPLTKREVEVLKLVAEGLTNAQIAEQLVLSPLTVNAHLRSIFNKLNVTTRTAAAHQGLELGLV
jgi:DNA-binding CsgD family transcriptional regulator